MAVLRVGLVDVSWHGGIGVLLLDRPDQLNALSIPMLEDVGSALRMLGSAATSNGIVITGAGRAFSAGDDLPASEHLERRDFDRLLELFQELTRAVLASEVPVVAALNGIAVGGAAELTLACDARIGHPGSDYLFPENNVGLTISNASTYLLPRLVGSRALPLILDGTRIGGERARELGLIDVYVDGRGGGASSRRVARSSAGGTADWPRGSTSGCCVHRWRRSRRPSNGRTPSEQKPGTRASRPRASAASSTSSEPAGRGDEQPTGPRRGESRRTGAAPGGPVRRPGLHDRRPTARR